MKTVAILQPNYIPWKGVFELMRRVDAFVFFDDVQYTKKDWRNRNRIKTSYGIKWVTVPVRYSQSNPQPIHRVEIDNSQSWQDKHFAAIQSAYREAPFFESALPLLHDLYKSNRFSHIADLSIYSTKKIADAFDIRTQYYRSSELGVEGAKDGSRAIAICRAVGATHFINGPSSKGFLNENLFSEAGISLEYMTYSYPEYAQLHGPFVHEVSALDLLFHCGPDSLRFLNASETQ